MQNNYKATQLLQWLVIEARAKDAIVSCTASIDTSQSSLLRGYFADVRMTLRSMGASIAFPVDGAAGSGCLVGDFVLAVESSRIDFSLPSGRGKCRGFPNMPQLQLIAEMPTGDNGNLSLIVKVQVY
ncbi:hypothetical protein Tcan_10794 [Toxocara canis]|uniref:Uncharacterized protein n=1 Tax=Toxocara canis TaxID=6265 RepID=A0A0B2UYP7_TOXCA|nr:hypothetical protein Tcan_10794 [Toxocara canis]